MNMNLYEYIRGRQRLLSSEIICKFMYQLLKALEYLHRYSFKNTRKVIENENFVFFFCFD
jgi:serine/threonine protein kinase